MKLRLIRRPASGADEFPASMVHRVLVANGYHSSRAAHDVIGEAIFGNGENGYTIITKAQQRRAHLLFSEKQVGKNPLWLAGGLCVRCLLSNNPLSIAAAHPDFRVCLRHKLKTHAYCPRCSTPSSISWLIEQRCASCRLHIYKFRRTPCTNAELANAAGVAAWLAGPRNVERHTVLEGLWHLPWYLRPWLLRSLLNLVNPRPKHVSYAELHYYFDSCRMWLLQHAADWQRQLLIALSERCAAPSPGATFADSVDWLHRCVNGTQRKPNRPVEASSGAAELLSVLISGGFINTLDLDPAIRRSRAPSHASCFNENALLVEEKVHRTCQLSLPLDNPMTAQLCPIVPLEVLNKLKTLPRQRSSSPELSWGRSVIRYQIQSPRKRAVDLFEAAVRNQLPMPVQNGNQLVSLAQLRHRLGPARSKRIESDIVRGRLRIHQIGHTGEYWRDIYLDLQDVGICERNAKGGQHVRDQLF